MVADPGMVFSADSGVPSGSAVRSSKTDSGAAESFDESYLGSGGLSSNLDPRAVWSDAGQRYVYGWYDLDADEYADLIATRS